MKKKSNKNIKSTICSYAELKNKNSSRLSLRKDYL